MIRTVGQALPRYSAMLAAGTPWREEGNGLGFSIGGFHPFRINDWKAAVKKVDSNITRTLHIDKIPIIGDLHKTITGAVDRLDSSLNKDFQKAKTWSQAHRKELQWAAAIAAASVGGWYAFSSLSASGAGAAAATGAEGVSTSAVLTAPTIGALSTTSEIIPASLLAPATVGAGEALTAAGTVAAAATGGSSLLSTIGSVLGVAAKDAVPLLALAKALGIGPAAQQAAPVDMGGGYYGGGYGGSYGGGGGGGGFLGPSDLGTGQDTGSQQAAGGIPGWAWIAAGGLALYLFTE